MTLDPVTAPHDLSLEEAQERMLRAGVRHLPVLRSGRLVDVVTDRDLAAYQNLARTTGPMTVGEIRGMAAPYICTPSTPLALVARSLVACHVDAAVVLDDRGHVVGIFTTMDALRFVGGEITASGQTTDR